MPSLSDYPPTPCLPALPRALDAGLPAWPPCLTTGSHRPTAPGLVSPGRPRATPTAPSFYPLSPCILSCPSRLALARSPFPPAHVTGGASSGVLYPNFSHPPSPLQARSLASACPNACMAPQPQCQPLALMVLVWPRSYLLQLQPRPRSQPLHGIAGTWPPAQESQWDSSKPYLCLQLTVFKHPVSICWALCFPLGPQAA